MLTFQVSTRSASDEVTRGRHQHHSLIQSGQVNGIGIWHTGCVSEDWKKLLRSLHRPALRTPAPQTWRWSPVYTAPAEQAFVEQLPAFTSLSPVSFPIVLDQTISAAIMSGEFNRTETNGDGFNGPNGSAPGSPDVSTIKPASSGSAAGLPKAVEDVIYSDIGVATLLNRLKQSIASARDFAAFLKKRSSLEEEQATGLKRLSRSQLETLRREEVKKGSYASQLTEVMKVHERMADNGMQFALSLHQMHEDLNELSANMERGRKQWKHEGLDAEKRASDAEAAMQKAKSKYDNLAEEYDRARTGDTKGSKRIGIKGPKSAEQYEQDLLRKTQAADQDYEERVKQAKRQRESLIRTDRPKAVKSLQELIRECDSALALQLQKFGRSRLRRKFLL